MTEAAPIQLWGSVQCKTFTYIGMLIGQSSLETERGATCINVFYSRSRDRI